jgi:hypothetical protein
VKLFNFLDGTRRARIDTKYVGQESDHHYMIIELATQQFVKSLYAYMDHESGDVDKQGHKKLFREYLSIYPNGHLHPQTLEITMQTLENPIFYSRMCDTAVLVYTQGKYKDVDEVLQSLLFRYPVYYGKPEPDRWNEEKAKRVLPYMRITQMIDNAKRHPYALGSIVRCAVNGDTRNVKEIGVLHTWGVNFESDTTADFKEMVGIEDDGSRKFKAKGEDAYRERVEQTLDNVFRAMCLLIEQAKTINEQPIKMVVLRFPSLGLDTYLKGLDPSGTDGKKTEMGVECRTIFMNALNLKTHEWIHKKNDQGARFYKEFGVQVYICDKTDANYELIYGDKHVVHRPDLLTISQGDVADRVMTIIVNESNPHSFIGNGGILDQTIDGQLVAGAPDSNDNSKFYCDASLHAYVIASRFKPTPYSPQGLAKGGGNAHTSFTRAHQNKTMYRALCAQC